jgi:hypothetical protein
MMANEEPADPAWLLMFGVFLFGTLCLYVLLVSDWYWNCRAQIDPATLTPLVCKPPGTGQSRPTVPPKPNTEMPREQQLWPEFGAANKYYEDHSVFWGDDFVSRFFKAVFDTAAWVAKPFVVDEVVPRWNRVMWPEINRKTILAALSLILGVVAKEWTKDVYRVLRKPKRDPAER